ncbi:MSC_0623 family F1-like ATPase-associated protein [Mycoplasma sp. 1012]
MFNFLKKEEKEFKKIRSELKKNNDYFWILENYNKFINDNQTVHLKDILNNIKLLLNSKEEIENFDSFFKIYEKSFSEKKEIDFDLFSIIWMKNDKFIFPAIKKDNVFLQEKLDFSNNEIFKNIQKIFTEYVIDVIQKEKKLVLIDGIIIYFNKEENFELFYNEKQIKRVKNEI